MKPKRRQARIIALNVLYSMDISKTDREKAFSTISASELEIFPEALSYAREIVRGVLENLPEIDKIISGNITNWKIERLSYVDRNILRIGVYELCSGPGVPPKSAINEAIEISKLYCEERAGKFINGILDGILKKGVKIG